MMAGPSEYLTTTYMHLLDAGEYAGAALRGDPPAELAEKVRKVLDAIAEASSLTAQAIREAQRYLD